MGKKIIRLTESELYKIVKKVIQEQDNSVDLSYYEINGTGLKFKVIDGKLYYAITDKNNVVIPKIFMNGNVADFKVNPDTEELISNKGFENSIAIADDFSAEINSAPDIMPMQNRNVDFMFIGLLPNIKAIGTPRNPKMVGRPIVFTASILQEDINKLESMGLTKSEDGSISPLTYVKKGRNGIYVKLFPSGGYTSYYSGEPEETPEETPFELNIESPFKFDSVLLTDDAKKEFDKFIQSIKTNYANATGDVQVTCSSSIDGDPEGKVASGQKRKDYDMVLSKKRAETIVSTLKNSLPGIKLNFIPNGIGETDQFATDKKWPQVKDINQTAPNRRLIIKLPQIMKQQ